MEVVVVAEEVNRPAKVVDDVRETPENGIGLVIPGNRIQVSSGKKPVRFYVNLAKRIMHQHNEVVLSALGKAIGTVVSISEILKATGWATEKKISTSTIESKDENRGRLIHKAKVNLLGKAEHFDDLMGAGRHAEPSEVQKN
ncbi:unnamed protein product [Spirodela intermedia]|uniref:DNA/RNA-binding protein Alba-like domain-containing protein n=1 Tax=Spirodela intermedia TaxID=51605 RepID=A0A7I8JCM6_SPIIN|nr:unnamed protein product [Spirodela intermedia]CAA6667253.1 unnamed protein product [Spirodela intermedia]